MDGTWRSCPLGFRRTRRGAERNSSRPPMTARRTAARREIDHEGHDRQAALRSRSVNRESTTLPKPGRPNRCGRKRRSLMFGSAPLRSFRLGWSRAVRVQSRSTPRRPSALPPQTRRRIASAGLLLSGSSSQAGVRPRRGLGNEAVLPPPRGMLGSKLHTDHHARARRAQRIGRASGPCSKNWSFVWTSRRLHVGTGRRPWRVRIRLLLRRGVAIRAHLGDGTDFNIRRQNSQSTIHTWPDHLRAAKIHPELGPGNNMPTPDASLRAGSP